MGKRRFAKGAEKLENKIFNSTLRVRKAHESHAFGRGNDDLFTNPE
jgi:hypothetical protein